MIITTENLTKRYKEKAVLNGVGFQVAPGEIHAILGKNGAGKSTFIKIALGLVYPSGGEIRVFGKKPGRNNKQIGYLSENITLYPHLSAKENLKIAAYSANTKMTNKDAVQILERVNLSETGNKAAQSFSLGMKRRLQLAMATMVKKAAFLILDEPTNGLDINGLLWLKEYLKEQQANGVSLLLASHAIMDLQECISNYVILHNGVIKAQGKWSEEKEEVQGVRIIVPPQEMERVCRVINSAQPASAMGLIERCEKGEIFLRTNRGYKEICEFLYGQKIFPESVTMVKTSLESVFLDTIKE
jgi:ABC-type multidrug transport system ATPase subunit